MINHMVSDPVRAITQAKRKLTKEKYENTYLEYFEKLVPYGSDKKAYEKRVKEIITILKGNRKYYVAAFPFYNSQNSQVYSLIHCTSNEEGFKLYKNCAWKVSVKSTCIPKMPSQRSFTETANFYSLSSTFRGSIPGQQLAKFFWLSKI